MRCLFFDCPVTVGLPSPPTLATLPSALKAVGGNTGNILFCYGIATSVDDDLVPCHWSDGQQLASDSHFDAVVLGAVNWLSVYHHNDNHKRANILRSLNRPILCIGLGVQSDVRTSKKLDFPDACLVFLAVLRSLDATVLVRDEFTFDQCVHYGLKNVSVIGCPSNFIDLSSDQISSLAQKSSSSDLQRTVSLNHGYSRRDICRHGASLLDSVCNSGGIYVVQDNLNSEIEVVLSSMSDDRSISRRLPFRRRLLSFASSRSLIRHNLSKAGNRAKVYFNPIDWMQGLRSSSLVLGSRIHGCIVALQAGITSAITTIDSRTEGLAETLAIPRVKIDRRDPMKKSVTPSRIIDLAGLDYAPYFRRRSYLLSAYKSSVAQFGLTLSSRLVDSHF